MEHIQLLIIGSGPAGYTAAIYACRANLKPVMLEGIQPGGQLTTTTTVENYPGFPQGIEGFDLMEEMRKQAETLGTDLRSAIAVRTGLSQRPYRVWIDDEAELTADAIIIATGATAKYLGLEDEKKYNGLGVSAGATCDGFFYRKKTVAVVGGGDTACEEASYLSQLAEQVYLIVRKPFLRASKVMQERVLENPKIKVLFQTETEGLFGDGHVQGAHLVEHTAEGEDKHYDLPIDGFFLAIGHKPNSDIFRPWVEVDETGYIVTQGPRPLTSVPGVFAAGDVADPLYRQAVIAAGSGAKAAMEAEKYLAELGK